MNCTLYVLINNKNRYSFILFFKSILLLLILRYTALRIKIASDIQLNF